jgi:hypothetical protein
VSVYRRTNLLASKLDGPPSAALTGGRCCIDFADGTAIAIGRGLGLTAGTVANEGFPCGGDCGATRPTTPEDAAGAADLAVTPCDAALRVGVA